MYIKRTILKYGNRDICFSGNSTVEAALVFPLVILAVIALIITGIKMTDVVKKNAEENKAYAQSIKYPAISAETVLRFKWLGIELITEN